MLKKLQLYFTLTVFSLGLALPASAASVSDTQSLQQDLAFAFGEDNTNFDGSSLSLAESFNQDDLALLSVQEMMATEGEWGPWGAIGGFGLGAWSYGGYLAGGGRFSWSGALGTIGGSTLAGAWGGPIGIARYYGASRTSASLGYGIGRFNSYGW